MKLSFSIHFDFTEEQLEKIMQYMAVTGCSADEVRALMYQESISGSFMVMNQVLKEYSESRIEGAIDGRAQEN